jgi:hypothetical protein
LADVLNVNLIGIVKLACPLIIFAGRHDSNVNSQLAAEWLAKVKAPSKHFEWFENSAHLPMNEEPGKFLMLLLRYARPIAERSGDSPQQLMISTGRQGNRFFLVSRLRQDDGTLEAGHKWRSSTLPLRVQSADGRRSEHNSWNAAR